MEGNVYKQVYQLDDSDSESSVEENSEDSDETGAREEIDETNFRAISPPSWLKVVYDEDTNEEPKLKSIVYKTTYRTSNEQQSSSEVSYDEDSNQESEAKKISYKTVYRTLRKEESSRDDDDDESSPEEIYDDNDPDYEPKEERIKRYKKKQKFSKAQKSLLGAAHDDDIYEKLKAKENKSNNAGFVMYREKQSSPEVLCDNGTSEERKIANVRKLKKTSIELQPTPGAKYIEIPIPNCNQQKFKQTYRKEWETEPSLKDWIQPLLEDSMYAYCKFCKCKLMAHKKSLKDHSNSKKHRKNFFDMTGVWGGSSFKPANLTFLMPQSRRKTEKILMNEHDSSSLSFANSSDFNMRVINDPLLPISS